MTDSLLVPIDVYLQSGIHIGSKYKTGFMRPYIYKIRPDGLCVLNIAKIDEKLRAAAKMLANYDPDKILVVCRRDNGHKAVKAFAKATGAKAIAGRYLPGTMTNPSFPEFTEPDVLVVSDPWLDRQAIKDAVKSNIPVIALCDTNNTTENVDLAIPCNNKGNKSLSLVYFILAREYLKARGEKERAITLDMKEF
ncbi:MAG: 30S ribosomal protein S2 [Nanoarchaeota archaeon]|nr:30S ribosomal protein S2 [Nanoarchaeota archaeon]